MRRITVLAILLPLMVAAAGCAFIQPNQRIHAGATKEWAEIIGPELKEYMLADIMAAPEEKATIEGHVAAYEGFLADPPPRGIVSNRKWRDRGLSYALPVSFAYLAYVDADKNKSDRLKVVLRRTIELHLLRWTGTKKEVTDES